MASDNVVINLMEELRHGDEANLQASKWSPNDVSTWLCKIGYNEYATSATSSDVPINGKSLLQLTDNDMQGSPLFMKDINKREHLLTHIVKLRETEQSPNRKRRKDDNTVHSEISISPNDCSGDEQTCSEPYPPEKIKTMVSVCYLVTGLVATVVSIQFTHERVPPMDQTPPLPDLFFDMVPYRFEKAFNVCEIIGMILTGIAAAITLFHRHRFIIFRRVAFIIGTLYIYRACTMYVTTLPVPGIHFKCSPKVHGNVWDMIKRALGLMVGGGLSVTDSHHLCGDYLYSGHTLMMVVSYLTIHEYTPKRWWYFHWICWMLACAGIFCILLAHDHYTVDVVVAYIITTRLFYGYHTLCNHQALKESGNLNLMARCWWFPMFRYFEGNVRSGHLPLQYDWPLPWPKRFRSQLHVVRV